LHPSDASSILARSTTSSLFSTLAVSSFETRVSTVRIRGQGPTICFRGRFAPRYGGALNRLDPKIDFSRRFFMAMNVPGAARQVFEDRGEQLDASQILLVGGSIAAGQTYNNQLYGQSMAQDNITAHAGGGQANGVLLLGPLMRITTVATAGDSILLPPSIRGMEVIITNDAAVNAANIFPAVGEAINALGANTAFSLTVAAGPTLFFCFSNGLWRTR
jgi:hypothetical protein